SIVNFQLSTESLAFFDANGKKLLQETPNGRTLKKVADQGFTAWQVAQAFDVPADDYQFGTGQFQDGNLNVKGLTRRLTQVNTQIALPMIISNKGYGILWNNAGLTEFNPAAHCLTLAKEGEAGEKIVVDATGTTGNKREERQYQQFTATLTIPETAEYSLLLDVGQSMARQHYLEIDGKVLYEANNLWLPPTTAVKAMLTQGEHIVVVRGEKNDTPSLYYNKVSADRTIFSSPVAQTLDYTIFTGTADEIIASYRALTGEVPMLPRWAFGYVHCRERYVSQDDVLKNAAEFRKRNIPIDMIVQDWQWWGNTGWNSMEFDPKNYANPKAMTDSLHNMNIKLMLSVWAKIDHNSKLGKQMEAQKNYIPNTDWIDFFSKKAGNAYWEAYKKNILPTGIDAWWQDATEPENDDLANRLVDKGRLSGNAVRNVFPFAVNDVVYNGLLQERPNERPMIMTRSASPGIQRFGVLTWSGDVCNDYKTLERQIIGGLGQMACGIPWWTYDAGGFFRPSDQYTNADYQQRMIRWIQNAVYLPVMRVHGYMSQTEPWRYTDSQQSTYSQFVKAIRKRYN
ncbi:MAG: glycosyl hydrolase family 31, partial [Bacteroidaceae bacterium]|nr:glycosyl hydrolase family 31 [Bacteroidaceae bacterium]